jgi:hypothetical protein
LKPQNDKHFIPGEQIGLVFRLLDDCLITLSFILKITKVARIFGLLSPMLRLRISFNKFGLGYVPFGRFFSKTRPVISF